MQWHLPWLSTGQCTLLCVMGGGGGIRGPPCSGITPATALHVASTQPKPHPSLPLKKYEMGVEEVERQWDDRFLERLNNVGDKLSITEPQMVNLRLIELINNIIV